MSSVRQEGKDKIIFVTKEDHEAPSNAELVEEDPNDPYEEQGLILPSGDINWNCPCLGGMASGPCGTEFKDAFSCFHYSKEEIKGSDCMEQFTAMQQCLQLYPELYPQEDEASPKQSSKDSAAEGPSAANSTPAPEQDSDTSNPNTESSPGS
uniref:Coiled-coil-helix-coiled-coil-helix domain containing 4b n=1 Tax=Oryzias latipes TaxID=8090 RepID=A0A3P9ISN0_ORYLA